MEYRVTLDTRAKITTIVCFALLGFLVYRITQVRIPPVISLSVTFILFLFFIMGYLYGPSKYIVSAGTLTIVRPAKKVQIPLADIVDVRALTAEETGSLNRESGSLGLFGYYGHFRSTRLGKLTLYTTRRDKRILITTADDERIVLSPDDLSMISALRR